MHSSKKSKALKKIDRPNAYIIKKNQTEIIEKLEKKNKPLQFDNASQSIDFKNINFDTDNFQTGDNHDITNEEILEIVFLNF